MPDEATTRISSYGEYLHEAMRHAQYERLQDGRWFASIPGFQGLWSEGASIEDARNDLSTALDGWLFVLAFVTRMPIPTLPGTTLDLERRAD